MEGCKPRNCLKKTTCKRYWKTWAAEKIEERDGEECEDYMPFSDEELNSMKRAPSTHTPALSREEAKRKREEYLEQLKRRKKVGR